MSNSTATKTMMTDARIVGIIWRALMALPVAIAAATPQMEMPDAMGAAHSGVNLKNFRATK